MGHSTVITDYLGSGPIADRPAAPNIENGCGAIWFASDVRQASIWNSPGSAWDNLALVPTSPGLVITDGTVLASGTIGQGLTLAGSGATRTLQVIDELMEMPLAVFHPGTLDDGELVMLWPAEQDVTLPVALAGAGIVFNAGTDVPTATATMVVSTYHAGTWTARGTLSVDTSGNLTVVGGLPATTIDIPVGDALRIVGQTPHDATMANFGLTLRVLRT